MDEGGEGLFEGGPDLVWVGDFVVVDEPVSHVDDLTPGDLGEVLLEGVGQTVGRLADASDDCLACDLEDAVGHEVAVTAGDQIASDAGEIP